MWDRLEMAQRRFEQICLTLTEPTPQRKGAELSLWLETEVCQVVEELVERPDFRGYTCWPLRQLAQGADSAERAQVEAADAALVEGARQLAALARQPAVRDALRNLGPHQEPWPDGAWRGHDPMVKEQDWTPIPRGLALLEYLASRPWRDLVAAHDYFYPVSDLNLIDRARHLGSNRSPVQVAEFLPSINPRLRPLGDFVSRTLLVRIDYWQQILQRCLVRCQTALRHDGQEGGGRWAAALSARGVVQEHYETLKARCLAGAPAKVRNACIALLQVFAAYRLRANLGWLGLPPEFARPAAVFRYRVERQDGVLVGEQIVTALLDIAPLFREGVDATTVLEDKCRSHALVVVMGRGRREVYWHGELVDVDWCAQRAPWDLLAALVESATSAQGADAFTLGDDRGALKDRRHRLKKLLPKSLDEAIQPAGRATYKLALGPEAICLLRHEEDEQFVEMRGGQVRGQPP